MTAKFYFLICFLRIFTTHFIIYIFSKIKNIKILLNIVNIFILKIFHIFSDGDDWVVEDDKELSKTKRL